MNSADVITYGNSFLVAALERVPRSEWRRDGVCGSWSVQDIVAHLASCEVFLGELLAAMIAGRAGEFGPAMSAAYSPAAVEARAARSADEVLDEYQQAYARVTELIGRIDAETQRRPGSLPWYGDEYALDDFIVYSFYGHKREHGAEIAAFADRLAHQQTAQTAPAS